MTSRRTYGIIIALVFSIVATISLAARNNVKRPADNEFGTGPRTSANGLYVATLKNADALKPRKMYAIEVAIAGANGNAVENATITIGGGMPQHGHGFPTTPRVTKALGGGAYEIGGLRFNMGGWWELKLTIATPSGTDTVTFNLAL